MARPGRSAIKPSSTRCPPPWQAVLYPSRHHRALLIALTLAAFYALLITPLPPPLLIVCAIFAGGLSTYQWSSLSRKRTLIHQPSEERWELLVNQTDTADSGAKHALREQVIVSGILVTGGYRSGAMIVLQLQSDDTRHHRIAIWSDQITQVQFSYLNYQLAYATRSASRRRLAAWFPGRILPRISIKLSSHLRYTANRQTTMKVRPEHGRKQR